MPASTATSNKPSIKTREDLMKLRRYIEFDLACLQEGGAISQLARFSDNIIALLDSVEAAQEPICEVVNKERDADGNYCNPHVTTLGDFDLEHIAHGTKLYAAPVVIHAEKAPALTLREQILALQQMIRDEASLQIRCALQDELDEAKVLLQSEHKGSTNTGNSGGLPTAYAHIYPEEDGVHHVCYTPSGLGNHQPVYTAAQMFAFRDNAPKTDLDGDALRLAVKHQMHVETYSFGMDTGPCVNICTWRDRMHGFTRVHAEKVPDGDYLAATRRAISSVAQRLDSKPKS